MLLTLSLTPCSLNVGVYGSLLDGTAHVVGLIDSAYVNLPASLRRLEIGNI